MQFTLVIARDEHNGIGRDGRIPWVNKQDIDIFRIVTTTTNDQTKKNLVVAGYRTREEMPVSLKNRYLVTLGRDASYAPPPGVEARDIEHTFIVGGRAAALAFYKRYGLPTCIVLTRVDGVFDCDVRLDDDDLWLDHYALYAKKRLDGATTFVYILRGSNSTGIPPGVCAAGVVPDEMQYTALVHDIIANGERRDEERTGIGALSVFGRQLRFDLDHSFPLFTTKRTFFRGVVEELAWFLSGETDASILDRRGCRSMVGKFIARFSRSVRSAVSGGGVWTDLWSAVATFRWGIFSDDRVIDRRRRPNQGRDRIDPHRARVKTPSHHVVQPVRPKGRRSRAVSRSRPILRERAATRW